MEVSLKAVQWIPGVPMAGVTEESCEGIPLGCVQMGEVFYFLREGDWMLTTDCGAISFCRGDEFERIYGPRRKT